ncbi:MAG: hypothetical protein NVSMB46_06060 [Candidatus Saccharimonadales bacterium]
MSMYEAFQALDKDQLAQSARHFLDRSAEEDADLYAYHFAAFPALAAITEVMSDDAVLHQEYDVEEREIFLDGVTQAIAMLMDYAQTERLRDQFPDAPGL